MKKNKTHSKGFSLLELAIVVTIIGVSLAAGLSILTEFLKVSKITQTKLMIEEVMDAINDYGDAAGILPCPANPSLKFDEEFVGAALKEALSNKCSGVTRISDGSKTYVQGMVPYEELGLFPTSALDAWGNRLSYIVAEASVLSSLGISDPSFANYELDVKNFDSSVNYQGVIVAVISHGANGYGAYRGRGGASIIPLANAITQEQNNATPSAPIHVAFNKAEYDDIVYFWTRDQIIDESME